MSVCRMRFFSSSLRRQVNITVCLPVEEMDLPELPQNRPERYPTLYLLHGFSGNEEDWLLGSDIDFLSMKHQVAVVMPAIENSFYLDDTAREAMYSQYIVSELVGFTRRVFPLSHLRQDTLIGGLSMGGYGALRNGLLHPDVFGSILAFSSALITDEVAAMQPGGHNGMAGYEYYHHTFGTPDKMLGSDRDPKALAARAKEQGRELPAIYMACGSEDFLLEPNRDMHRHLAALDIAHEYHESPGIHDWTFWNEYIAKALAWYSGRAENV